MNVNSKIQGHLWALDSFRPLLTPLPPTSYDPASDLCIFSPHPLQRVMPLVTVTFWQGYFLKVQDNKVPFELTYEASNATYIAEYGQGRMFSCNFDANVDPQLSPVPQLQTTLSASELRGGIFLDPGPTYRENCLIMSSALMGADKSI
uniref:Uncharacterized protein n=1 Tax=Sphaerodactylus townsendi TaxID=933632 RepID=A0ACB8F5Y4_9SAUR